MQAVFDEAEIRAAERALEAAGVCTVGQAALLSRKRDRITVRAAKVRTGLAQIVSKSPANVSAAFRSRTSWRCAGGAGHHQ
jgi:hypothetical protein